jgi:anion-transporting  ArsA/GET3 family ATPase
MLDKQFIMVSGKGGVGKSAVAAAIAKMAARAGRNTLALSMVGNGMGLGAHLGTTALEFRPQQTEPNLHALSIDRSKALVEYVQIQVGLPSYATFTPAIRAFDVLASTAPAIREIVTMGKVLWEAKTGHWDLVVADGPPTGQIGSFLGAATTMANLVSSGRVADQSKWMRELQMDPSASELVLVSVPEELPTSETIETLEWLDAHPVVGSRSVFANRVLPPLETDAVGSGLVADAASLHRSLTSEQAIWLERLPTHIDLPFLFGAESAAVVADRLAESMGALVP